jgi:biotin carboxyl carrier protein
MRYYLLGPENKEFVIDLKRTTRTSANAVEFEYQAVSSKGAVLHQDKVYLKKLASRFFVSNDGIKWQRISRQDLPEYILNINEVYRLYRGYKPSGLGQDNAGSLITQMPGKVVKILRKVGDQVTKGETLVILEAMKMENEIKSGSDGKIKAIYVKEGDALDQKVLMMEIE